MQPAASKSQPFVSQPSPPPVVTGISDASGPAPQFAGKTVTPLSAPGESHRTATTQRAGEDWVAVGSPLRRERKGAADDVDGTHVPTTPTPIDGLVLEAPEGLPGIQWRIRHCLGRTVSPASLGEDVAAVLKAIPLRGDDADRMLGAEIARQAGGRSVNSTQLQSIIRASLAHANETLTSVPMAQVSRFLMGVNDQTRPGDEREGEAVPIAFHAAVVSTVLRERSAYERKDLALLREWCEGTLQRGYPREFAAVLKAALTAPERPAGEGPSPDLPASPGELARRLRAVMEGVAQTDHLAVYRQFARSYVDKSTSFDAPTRTALQAVLPPAPQPKAGGDGKASGGASRKLFDDSQPLRVNRSSDPMMVGAPRPDPLLADGKAADIVSECRESLPRPVQADAWAARVLETTSLHYGPTGLRRLGAVLAGKVGGAGVEAAQREAILRACLRQRAQYPYIVPVASLRAFLVGMDGVFRGGTPADAVTFYTEMVRLIVETDPAFFGEAHLGPRRARDLLGDWSVDFTNRYPIHAFQPLLAVALPAASGATSVTTSSSSSSTLTPASGAAVGTVVPAALLAARLRAMIEGVEWIMHGPGLHQVVRSYIATAGFPPATREVLTQVLEEVLPPAKAGKAKAEPEEVGTDGQ